jgi:CheY-like chemotaxis protein/DNA-binding XRE family transcriptional regulator
MKPNVLLATGDVGFRKQLAGEVRNLCHLSFASSTTQARTLLENKEWAIVVIDTKLPGLDGLEVLHALRHAASRPRYIVTAGTLDPIGSLGILHDLPVISIRRTPEPVAGLLRAILDPSAQHKILGVRYQPNEKAFFVVFHDGKTYELPRGPIEADDGSPVVKTSVVDDGDAFMVRQASGNAYDVAWDFVLYHQEPGYPYYKGRPEQQRADANRGQRIGQRVRQAREERGWTLESLAERTGIQAPNLSRLEAGKHLPSLPTLERVAGALGISIAQLLAA